MFLGKLIVNLYIFRAIYVDTHNQNCSRTDKESGMSQIIQTFRHIITPNTPKSSENN